MKPDIASIIARANLAYPGPWNPRCDYQDDLMWLCNDKDYAAVVGKRPDGDREHIAEFCVGRTTEEAASHCSNPVDKPQTAANIEFIAAARTDVPALCMRVDELERELRGAIEEARLQGFRGWADKMQETLEGK